MTRHSMAGTVLFLLLNGCGNSGPTDTPSLESARLSPGTTLTVFIRTEIQDPDAGPGLEILSTGQPVEETLRICSITMSYWTDIVVAPAPSRDLGGAINRRLYAAVPLEPGTRLVLGTRNFCGSPIVGIFEATVIRGR